MSNIVKAALVNALLTALYVGVVGAFLFYAGEMKLGQTKTALAPIGLLLLLVFSAALVGALIFGRPVLWYIQGRAKDAVILLAGTMAILFAVTIAVFSTLVALR